MSQALHLIHLASRPWKEPLWRVSIPGTYSIPSYAMTLIHVDLIARDPRVWNRSFLLRKYSFSCHLLEHKFFVQIFSSPFMEFLANTFTFFQDFHLRLTLNIIHRRNKSFYFSKMALTLLIKFYVFIVHLKLNKTLMIFFFREIPRSYKICTYIHFAPFKPPTFQLITTHKICGIMKGC